MTATIEVSHATRAYGGKRAVDHVDLSLAAGRITCLLGPSGCGKSTLLRLIAGLEPLDGGRILANGRDITHLPPEQRDMGLVFQDYALFPHLRVDDNVGFGLGGLPIVERRARVADLLGRIRLGERGRAFPGELSGGEQQRVALVRALARRPHTVLLDEPFSGLDSHLKSEVREATLAVLRETDAAVLIVTHDAEEAMQMADELALMIDGRILQRGTPQACYLNPVSLEAARLLGEAQVIPAQVSAGVAQTAFGAVPAPGHPDGGTQVMLRPNALVPGPGVEADVSDVRFVGQAWRATLTTGGISTQARLSHQPGSRLSVSLDPEAARVLA